jgi:uncharacterized membrane protein
MMKTWLKELERALRAKFYDDEVKDILSYYEEIINDRLSSGEKLDAILSGYDVKKIVKDMTPEVLMKRKNTSMLRVSKSTRQLLIVLLGSPILLPLGIIYVSILIFVMSMMITAFVLVVSGLVGFAGLLVDMLQTSLSLPNILGVLGMGLMTFSMLILIALWMYQLMALFWRKLIVWFSKLAHRRGEKE